MHLRSFLIATVSLLSAFSFAATPIQEETAPIQEGEDYTILAKAIPSVHPKQVEIIEAFSYTCPACRMIEPVIKDYLAQHKGRNIVLRPVQVFWQPNFLNLIKLTIAVDKNHAGVPADKMIFDAIFDQHINLSNSQTANDWLNKQTAFDGKKVAATFNDPQTAKEAQQMAAMTNIYSFNATPTLIIGGKYKVRTDNIHSAQNLNRVLDGLIKKSELDAKPIPAWPNSGAKLALKASRN